MERFMDLLQKLFGEPWLHGEGVGPGLRKERLRGRLLSGRRSTSAANSVDGLGIHADGKSESS